MKSLLSFVLFSIVAASALSAPRTTPTPNPTPHSEGTSHKHHNEKELKHEIEAFFYIDFDWSTWTTNLTPYNPPNANSSGGSPRDRMVMDDYRNGIQKMKWNTLTGGLGPKLSYWYSHASGLSQHVWAFVGILPLLGRDVESVKYYSSPKEAENSEGLTKVPGYVEDLREWSPGDSITYVSRGGVLFSAGIGLGILGLGQNVLAHGSWETYVEKISPNKVYLKITKGTIQSLSTLANFAIATLAVSSFQSADDGFSYLYNLDTEKGRKAYEDAIRGNIMASDQLIESPDNDVETAPVLKVATFKTLSTGRLVSAQLGLPVLWNTSYSRGNISSFSASDFHISDKVARSHYGIYSEEKNYRFWTKHRETDLMFYGTHYTITGPDSSESGFFGRYNYAYRNDHTNARKLDRAIHALVRKTAIHELQVEVPDEDLGYAGIDFDATFSEEHTLRLMSLAPSMGKHTMQKVADRYLSSYSFNQDPYSVCKGEAVPLVRRRCANELREETLSAIDKMHEALNEMTTEKNRDPKAFARAYGELGEAMTKNFITFRTVLELAGPGVEINYLLEGSRISMYYKSWVTTATPNRWRLIADPNGPPQGTPFPFEPRLRRSKARGIVVNPQHGTLRFFQLPYDHEPGRDSLP